MSVQPTDSYGSVDTPWMLLPHERGCKQVSFYDMVEGKIRNFKTPRQAHGGYCCGASKGWLIIAKKRLYRLEFLLWNPVTGAQYNLPPLYPLSSPYLSTLFFPVSHFVCKMFLSSEHPADCVVAGIFGASDRLALCRLGDSNWSIYPSEDIIYRDGLFLNGTLCILTLKPIDNRGACTMKLRDCDIKVKFIIGADEGGEEVEIEERGDLLIEKEGMIGVSLVGSTLDNQLFLIKKYSDMTYRETNYLGWRRTKWVDCTTTRLEVHTVCDDDIEAGGAVEDDIEAGGGGSSSSKTPTLTEKVDNFGNSQTLYWGRDDFMLIQPKPDSPPQPQKNCIYFTEDAYSVDERSCLLEHCGFGVFNLNTNTLEPLQPLTGGTHHPRQVESGAAWFIPNSCS